MGDAGGSDGATDAGTDAGPTCTVLDWDPVVGDLTRWPEPALAEEDETTVTGLRLRLDPERYPGVIANAGGFRQVLTEDLSELDGFGTNAEAFFRFEGRPFDRAALPSDSQAGSASSGLGFLVLEPGPARLVPVLVDLTDEGRTLLFAPQRPLPAGGLSVAYITRALTDAAGGCLEPSPAMASLIEDPDAAHADAITALVDAGAIADADDLVALTVFRSQSVFDDTRAVAADIAGRETALGAAPSCTEEALFIRCDATFIASDYRDEDGVFRRAAAEAAEPRDTYEVPFTIWLPLEGERPFPVLLYGHGLSGDHGQGRQLAQRAAPQGFATVAAPALMHRGHPTDPDPDATALNRTLAFFAIGDLSGRALEAARLREHFRQTVWDRLQLTRWITQSPDVDGDDLPDLDGSRLSYLGVSLGGLMGPELLASVDDFGAAVLVVGGGRVSTIISDSDLFGPLVVALRPRGTTEGDVRRFFPVLQTILDGGDAASFAPHVLEAREPGTGDRPTSVLLGVALDDDIVPNISNYALGRAFGVPIVEPLFRPEIGFEVLPGPLSGNFSGGAATGGLLQFEVIGDGAGGTTTATHNNIGTSDVGIQAWLDFLLSHEEGSAMIRDPYAAIGLEP